MAWYYEISLKHCYISPKTEEFQWWMQRLPHGLLFRNCLPFLKCSSSHLENVSNLKHGFILLFCISWPWCAGAVPTGKQLLETAVKLQKGRSATLWAFLDRITCPWLSNSVFIRKILTSKRCPAAMKWTLFWRLTNLTSPSMWVIWGYHGRQKKPQSHRAEQVDSCQQIPKCLRGHRARSGALPTNIVRLWQRWQHSSHHVCWFSCT